MSGPVGKFTLRRADDILGRKGAVYYREGKYLVNTTNSVYVKLCDRTSKLFKPVTI